MNTAFFDVSNPNKNGKNFQPDFFDTLAKYLTSLNDNINERGIIRGNIKVEIIEVSCKAVLFLVLCLLVNTLNAPADLNDLFNCPLIVS